MTSDDVIKALRTGPIAKQIERHLRDSHRTPNAPVPATSFGEALNAVCERAIKNPHLFNDQEHLRFWVYKKAEGWLKEQEQREARRANIRRKATGQLPGQTPNVGTQSKTTITNGVWNSTPQGDKLRRDNHSCADIDWKIDLERAIRKATKDDTLRKALWHVNFEGHSQMDMTGPGSKEMNVPEWKFAREFQTAKRALRDVLREMGYYTPRKCGWQEFDAACKPELPEGTAPSLPTTQEKEAA